MEGLDTVIAFGLEGWGHQNSFILTACEMKTALFYIHVSKMNIYPNKDCWRSLFFRVIGDFINAVGYFSILDFFILKRATPGLWK